MILGIDIDDTISNTCDVMFNFAQEYVINVLNKEPIINESPCNTHYYMRHLHGFNQEQDEEFLKLYYAKILKETRPKTLAIEYLKKLKEEGHKIILITARWETEYADIRKLTKDWIDEYEVPCDKLIINAENKVIAAKSENVDVFIDDSFSNCKAVTDAGIKSYLMDSRTNKGLKEERIERVYSWPHLYMKLKR